MTPTKILHRRDLAVNWNAANPVLGPTELGFESDTFMVKLGNGVDTWVNLPYWAPPDPTKEPIITAGTVADYWRGDKTWQTLNKAAVGLGNVSNLAPADLPLSSAATTALAGKEPTVTAGTSTQYWRGDKVWATLDKAAVGLGNADNTSDLLKPLSTAAVNALALKANFSLVGAANGIAGLDSTGKVPATQLPSYVDDVVEYANVAAFPVTGEAGKLYLALDTSGLYRWTGTVYAQINGGGASLVLGETSSTAYRGDLGKIAYDHTFLNTNPHGVTAAQVGLGSVANLAPADLPLSSAATTALAGKEPSIATLPISKGGTGSPASLVGNRLTRSQLLPTPAIVELGALNASVALVSDAQGLPTSSPTSATEVGYLQGLASNVQAQINAIVFGKEFQTDLLASPFVTTSSGLVTAHTFTTAVLPAGTYRIEWDAAANNNGANRTVTLRTRVATVPLPAVNASFRQSAASIVGTLHRAHYHVLAAPGTLMLDIQVSGSAGTTTVGHSRITLWRVA